MSFWTNIRVNIGSYTTVILCACLSVVSRMSVYLSSLNYPIHNYVSEFQITIFLTITDAKPMGDEGIIISMYVCLSVCLFSIIHVQIWHYTYHNDFSSTEF